MARSSSDQCETGRPSSAGLVVASTMTLCRSSGGKSPRSTAARKVGQAVQALGGEACSPLAHRTGIAVQFPGHLVIGGAVALAAAEDEAAAKGLSLWGRVGVSSLAELLLLFAGETDEWRASGHAARSLCKRVDPCNQ